jgi:hypothetical protein
MVRAATAFPALATLLQRLVDGPDGETTLPRLIEASSTRGPTDWLCSPTSSPPYTSASSRRPTPIAEPDSS